MNKTTLSISRAELIEKERYGVLVRGINLALIEMDSDIQVEDVTTGDARISMEFSRKDAEPAPEEKEALANIVIKDALR
jgi:hypothetical protein